MGINVVQLYLGPGWSESLFARISEDIKQYNHFKFVITHMLVTSQQFLSQQKHNKKGNLKNLLKSWGSTAIGEYERFSIGGLTG